MVKYKFLAGQTEIIDKINIFIYSSQFRFRSSRTYCKHSMIIHVVSRQQNTKHFDEMRGKKESLYCHISLNNGSVKSCSPCHFSILLI